jgi:regulator of protease activity HflC (stomatin/prohibitin superfamily)
MAKSNKELDEGIRNEWLAKLKTWLDGLDVDNMQVKSNEIAIPVLDAERNDKFLVLTLKVPTGSRDDGEAYDGYALAEQYAESVAAKAEKAKADAEKKARKIAADKAKREAMAKAKAEHEAKKLNG